jgi:DNA polymerase-3 subunit gamma/tau
VSEEKQYQSLYRKYRPQGPQEVLGQEHVVRALMGAVNEGRLAHAFLFCGPRGTGKTSTARILAKMVNCEKGPTAEPCGTCSQCVTIRDGHHLDVVEIDAASHGSVDSARDLREKAPTAPVQGREKVYIIDEAQRLSREAFDALLKLFEEPPLGVRFVLATTEPHKMPATIIGRCQRFDFRRVPVEIVSEHLLRIAEAEGLKLSPEAAHAIARHTEGSLRDALSLLDQASLLGGGQVDEDVLSSLVGSGQTAVHYELADAVAVGDARSVFEIVHGLVQQGQDLRHVTQQALSHFRDLLLVRTAPGQVELVDVQEDEYERLRAQAAKMSPAEISRVISLLLQAQNDMRWTTSPRISLELALVRATVPEADPQPHALVARVERLERVAGIEADGAATPEAPAATQRKSPAETERRPPSAERRPPATEGRKVTAAAAAEDPKAPPAASGAGAPTDAAGAPAPAAPVLGAGTSAVDVAMLRRSWSTLIEHLRSSGKAVLPSFLEVATPVAFDGQSLELAFPPDRKFGVVKVEEREGELRSALQELFGISPRVRCVVRDPVAGAAEPVEEDPPLSEEEALARIKSELGAEIAGDQG